MRFKIISVGKIKDKNLLELVNDFAKKISYEAKLELLEIKDSDKKTEGKKILDKVNDEFLIALSEEGKQWNSRELAKKIKDISLTKTICFVIGGPFGLSEEVKNKSSLILSLSKMTFTHEMAKLFLLEQVYRAISIIKNKNYHKD